MKREVKRPKQFVERSEVDAKRKVPKPGKTLYKIEIIYIDKAQDKVKIHYTGYALEFNEWRSCDELGLPICLVKFYVPVEDSLEDRYNPFYDIYYLERERKDCIP